MPTDLRWVVTGVTWLLLAVPIVTTRTDPDLWGHTRFGLDMLASRTIPVVDPYSFTQDRPWVNHEWLSELLMGIAYQQAGATGLIVLKALVLIAAYVLIASAFRPVHPLVGAGCVLLAAWGGLLLMLTVRPQIWTFLGLAVTIRLLRSSPAFIPLVFAIWVNLHGGWIVGLGVVGVWCAVSAVQSWRDRRRALFFVTLPILSFGATVLNPYGVGMWRFLAQTVRPGRDITEWQPLSTYPPLAVVPLLLIAVIAVAVCVPKRSRPAPAWLAVLALLAAGSWQVSRISVLAAPLTLLILAPSITVWWPGSSWRWRAPSAVAAALTAVPLLLMASTLAAVMRPALSCIQVLGDWIPDAGAAGALEAGGATGRIVTPFNWGQYALWHLSPELRVSLDGRRETVYSDAVLDLHQEIFRGGPLGDEWLAEHRPEYVWLPADATGRRDWLAAHGYRVDWSSDRSYVLTRADRPQLQTGPVLSGCFPQKLP